MRLAVGYPLHGSVGGAERGDHASVQDESTGQVAQELSSTLRRLVLLRFCME